MIIAPVGWKQVHLTYGNPSFTELSGGNVDIEDAWEAENLVLIKNVCGTNLRIRLHHRAVEPFERALAAALVEAPQYTIRLLGGYSPRHQRHDPKLPLSIHALGAAIDINWDKNPMGSTLITDLPPALVAAFKREGWEWGGDWKKIKDAMHFQFAVGV